MTQSDGSARVTYRDVLRNREFSAILGAQVLSVLGDQLARLAVAVLVFERTSSTFAASATYAISFATWVLGGPVLTAWAERYSRRTVMVLSDLVRAVLVACMAVPDAPLVLLFVLLLTSGALAPPFEGSRGALVSELLPRAQFVVGNGLMNSVFTFGQVLGFAAGGAAIGVVGTQGALLLNSSSFLLSAALLIVFVGQHSRVPRAPRQRLLTETGEGLRLVRGTPELRQLLCVAVLGMCMVISAEGLAVPIAAELEGGAALAGLLTAAIPLGYLIGSLVLVRQSEQVRSRAVRPLLLTSAAALALSVVARSPSLLVVLWVVAGVGSALQVIINSQYVLATPPEFRARAFGVAASALMGAQAVTLLGAGLAAEALSPRTVVSVIAVAALAVWWVLARDVRFADPAAQAETDIGRGTS